MKIVISASMQFAEKMFEIKEQLNQLGHEAFIDDDLAKNFLGKSDEEKEIIKIYQKNNDNAMYRYWELMQNKDALLVLNFDKNGVKNYVGGNAFLEIGWAYALKQKIFLYNPIPEIPYYKTEIEAIKPIIINGDLLKIV